MSTSNYYINENDEFVIEDYNRKKPFSSFLPAVSGLYGKPMWAYYVNRGQCMASFGVNNKDYSIMEFQPANKAYRQTALVGFRTFLKVTGGNGAPVFYEPFSDRLAEKSEKISQKMRITSYNFKLEDCNEELGIKTEVLFATLPEESIPALIRRVKITNIGEEPVNVEVLDGLPVLIPYYLINHDMKNESNLCQAWMSADMTDGKPFYRIKALPYDTEETVLLTGGNFYLNFKFDNGQMQLSKIITDPTLIFGNVTDFTYPDVFCQDQFTVPDEQVAVGYTPCGFGYQKLTLAAGENDTTDTLIGSAPGIEQYQDFLENTLKPDYMDQKIAQNRELIERTKRHAFMSSNSRELDLYMGQTFMDNYLRGGYPVKVGNGKHVMYVYSRKHGDLEREYNFFQVDSTNYSQGNSNFRDVNQNRRNDVYFFPFTGKTGIRTFFNLLQLDGYNPLVLNGSRFEIKDEETCRNITKVCFGEKYTDFIMQVLKKAYTPGSLLLAIEQTGIRLNEQTRDRYINDILENSIKEDYATFQEGYWVDHWTYDIDLLEQYRQVYPDQMQELLFEDQDYTWYDSDSCVVPREERYVLTDLGVRQYGAVRKSEEKEQLLASRSYCPNQVRTDHGNGEICHSNLMAKIVVLLTNKIASLDPEGIGLEMKGGKPGWCDALNGLPGILGSSINESAEVRRLAVFVQDVLKETDPEKTVVLPEEAAEFFDEIAGLLGDQVTGMDYWNRSNDAKEAYRKSVFFGISGQEKEITVAQIVAFAQAVTARMDEGLKKAYNKETGVYDTYYIREAVRFEELKEENGAKKTGAFGLPLVHVDEFKMRAIPPFLEGQVHMMRADQSVTDSLHQAVKKSGMYDEKLDMFKVNANIMDETKEIGRQNVFPRGWLENEAVFLHMEYKYFLELLRSGLYEEFFHYVKTSFVPLFPGWLFTEQEKEVALYHKTGEETFTQPKDSVAFYLLGETLTVYHNEKRLDTFQDDVAIQKITLQKAGEKAVVIDGSCVPAPYAEQIRNGEFDRIDAVIDERK